MNNSEQLIIYLDTFVFLTLISLFILLFKSSIFYKKNKKIR